MKRHLEGVWQLASAKSTRPDTTIEYSGEDWQQWKIVTKKHFMWIGREPDRAKVVRGTDEEILAAADSFGAGGGTYTLKRDTYTEHIDFFSNPNLEGVSVPFKCQVKGDQWIHSGTLPLKEADVADYDVEIYEVCKRIE